MKVRLLGVPTFIGPDGAIPLRPGLRGMTAYLFMHPGQQIARHQLADLFWPESDESHAASSLRTALHSVRSAFDAAGEPDALDIERNVVVPRECEVDALLFDKTVRGALTAAVPGDVSDLIAAVPLYRGDFLMDADGLPPEVECWCDSERQRLRDLYVAALATLVRHFSEADLPHAALNYGVRWRRADPWNEEAARALMRLYSLTGQPALAAKEFERIRTELDHELGLDPSEETLRVWEETGSSAVQVSTRPLSIPRSPSAPHLSADARRNALLLTVYGEQKILSGDADEGLDALSKARAIHEELGAQAEANRTRLTAANALVRNVVSPRPDLALAEITPLVEFYRAGASPNLARALLVAADALQYCFRYSDSIALAEEGIALARAAGNWELETRLALVRGLALTGACEFTEATEAIESAIPELAALGEPREMLRAMVARGTLAMLNESWTDAEQYLLEAIGIAAKLPSAPAILFEEGYARAILIIMLWGLERDEEARAAAEDVAFDLGSTPGGDILMAICLPGSNREACARSAACMVREALRTLGGWPGQGYARIMWQQFNLLGMNSEALPWSALNIRLARTVGLKAYEASGYSTRGITQAQLGNLKSARRCLAKARGLTGDGPFFAVGYLKHLEGLVARADGDFAAARGFFEEAIRTWRGNGEVQFVRLIQEEIDRLPAS